MDDDGDLDAVVAGYDGSSKLYLNQGESQGGIEGVFADNRQLLAASMAVDVELQDLDGDGDLDVFLVKDAFEDASEVWLNQGDATGFFLHTYLAYLDLPCTRCKILSMLTIKDESSSEDRVNLGDWKLLMQFGQVFRSATDIFADQAGLSRGQASVLCVVARHDGLSQTEIAETLSVQGATVSNMVQKLEEAALVLRRRDSEDNRLVRVYLTEAGRDMEASINTRFGILQEQIFQGLSSAERSLLLQWLTQIMHNIDG